MPPPRCYNTRAMTMTAQAIADRLRATPMVPGVYIMRGGGGAVLYVGKAAILRNRLRSYFGSPVNLSPKIRNLVGQIADFEYVVTENETEALILENTLIKLHKPQYNARLKDDKTYPYIKIDLAEEYPQVYFTRRVLPDGARYFGPFASAWSVRTTMDLLKKLFPYRSCTKPITGTDTRPCLEYYIHRCVAPCIGAVSQEEYREVIDQVVLFMEGKTDRVLRDLRQKMAEAAAELHFERAALLRDQVRAIERVGESQKVEAQGEEDRDVVALAMSGGEAWVEVFFVRHGKLLGREHYLMEGTKDDEPPQILGQFVKQFYDRAPYIPRELLLQYPLAEEAGVIEAWLAQKRGRRVTLLVPERGAKRRLVQMVADNAAQGLQQRAVKWQADTNNLQKAMEEVAEALSLPRLPQRMECYDISNIQGTNSVGSMVVFEGARPKNSHYRRFQIKSVEGVDDYSMMQEMLRRRFRRLSEQMRSGGNVQAEETTPTGSAEGQSLSAGVPGVSPGNPSSIPVSLGNGEGDQEPVLSLPKEGEGSPAAKEQAWGIVPDLVLIDGGKGHLTAALQVFLELGLVDTVPLASLAKEREELFVPHNPEPVMLPRGSQGLFLMQRIRDEAHRFAITYHRQRRSKGAIQSVIDSVPGIGPKRRRLLIQRFGSVAGIKAASMEEVASVPGMTMKLAQKVKEYL
ncbi:MAG: excinuclease ABC subunit UvrC [Dehalococcoidia bacterium]|nr:excinuclease ABC subunit UvrC [Dehalococcoidia bacterium]